MKTRQEEFSDDSDQTDSGANDLIAIGKIVRARGIRGELVVAPLTDFPDRFAQLDRVLLERPDDGGADEFAISSVRSHKSQLLLKLDGIDDRSAAEALIGSYLSVTRDELVQLEEGDFYQFEVIGMGVVSEEGEHLGTISEIMQFPANDVWRIEGKQAFLLPAIKDVVKKVDREKREVTIHLIEGLIPNKASRKDRSE